MSRTKGSACQKDDLPQTTVAPNPSRTGEAGSVAETTDTGKNHDQRRQTVAVAAYFLAEQRGFCPGFELDDWLKAEANLDRQRLGQVTARGPD